MVDKKPVPKIIFLDFDGVINSIQSHYMHKRAGVDSSRVFCPLAISNLKRILETHKDARIVISSSWRKYYSFEQIQAIMEQYGIGHGGRYEYDSIILSRTPITFSHLARGAEIRRWLNGHDIEEGDTDKLDSRLAIKDFVILDDDDDGMKDLRHRFVKINSAHGLMYEDALKAIEILNG